MSDVVMRVRRELEARVEELEPAVDEYHRLKTLLDTIEGASGESAARVATTAAATSRRSSHSTRKRRTAASNGSRSRAKSGTRSARAPRGQRREQVLEALGRNGGAGARTVAHELGISENQVYNLIRKLRDEGLVKKTKQGTWVKA